MSFSLSLTQELELRIETQKQTLNARDESIKKLLEMLQTKGMGEFRNCNFSFAMSSFRGGICKNENKNARSIPKEKQKRKEMKRN